MRWWLVFLLGGWLAASAQGQTNDAVLLATLSLEQAYDRVLATDQTIAIAAAEVRKADLEPWSALTRLGLRVTGEAGYVRPEHELFSDSTPRSPVRENTKTAAILVEQPLLDLTVFPAWRRGQLTAEAARLSHQFAIRGVLFGVSRAYYEVLKQQRIVEVDRETLALATVQSTRAENRFRVGDVTKVDVPAGPGVGRAGAAGADRVGEHLPARPHGAQQHPQRRPRARLRRRRAAAVAADAAGAGRRPADRGGRPRGPAGAPAGGRSGEAGPARAGGAVRSAGGRPLGQRVDCPVDLLVAEQLLGGERPRCGCRYSRGAARGPARPGGPRAGAGPARGRELAKAIEIEIRNRGCAWSPSSRP